MCASYCVHAMHRCLCVCSDRGDRHTLSCSASSVTAGRLTNTHIQMPVQRLTSALRCVCFAVSDRDVWCMCYSLCQAPLHFLRAWSGKQVNQCYTRHVWICHSFQIWNNFICQEETNGVRVCLAQSDAATFQQIRLERQLLLHMVAGSLSHGLEPIRVATFMHSLLCLF